MIGIDLFAGAGMFGLGFAQAGFDIRAAVDISPAQVAAHRRNFPEVPVLCRSVAGLGRRELYDAAGLHWRAEVDVVFGGAPCQGFSQQGHQAPDDPRRSLVFDFVRVVGEVRPRHAVLENVKGLTTGNGRPVLDRVIAELGNAGYDCAPWQVLNARDYGVAQSRQRLFLLASRRDCRLIDYPQPLPGLVTCQDVLADLEDEAFARTLSGWRQTTHRPDVIARFTALAQGEKDASWLPRLRADGVSPTLTAGTEKRSRHGGRHTPRRPIHYRFPRVCTVRELARLHGIPDWVKLGNPYDSICNSATQIGNSVPPPLAAEIARQVALAIQASQLSRIFTY